MALAEDVGSKWAVGLDGKGYLVSTLDQESPFEYRAYTEKSVPLRTPRIDTSPEPGEASLGDLWVRSQHDWSEGMGQKIFDGENSSRLKSRIIGGFDPFLSSGLRMGAKFQSLGLASDYKLFTHGDLVYALATSGAGKIVRFDETYVQENVTISAISNDSHNAITKDNDAFYYPTSAGIYKIVVTDAYSSWVETEVKVNNLTNCTVLEFGKGRLLACKGTAVHVIDDLTSLTSGATADYTNIDTSWIWTDAQDLSMGFYLSGYSDADSKLYLMSFDTTDASAGLTIGIPREVWRAPAGERILCIQEYAGSAFLIGTNKGVRNVLIVDSSGNVVVGPLVETVNDTEVKSIGIWGKYAFFAYGHITTVSGDWPSIAKMDLSTFALAAPYIFISTINPGFAGTSVCIPPWYEERDTPIVSIKGNSSLSSRSGITIHGKGSMYSGIIRLGTSVPKELRRIELTIEPAAIALYNSAGDIGASLAIPPSVNNTNNPIDFLWRANFTSWVGAVGGQTLFLQGVSDADYRWRIRVDENRKLILQYNDTSDTIRTATSTDALPVFDVNSIVWIQVYKSSGTVIYFRYWVCNLETRYPGSEDWTDLGAAVSTGSSNLMKADAGEVTYIMYDPITTSDGLNLFDTYWFSYLDFPGRRLIAFRPYEYAPDLDGNTWVLDNGLIVSGNYSLFYNPDNQGWENLITSGGITKPNVALTFPDNTVARNLELRFESGLVTTWRYGVDLLEWRLLAEPVPSPRYYRHFVPVMLYDDMEALDGTRISRPGLAEEYLEYLRVLYKAGTVFDFQQPQGYLDPTASIRVRIEDMEFKSFAPPKGAAGFGGICLLVLKEVAT